MSEMRTPLSRVRGLGSAKKARSIFGFNVSRLWQYSACRSECNCCTCRADFVTVTAFLSHPIVALVMLLLILSMVWHMRLGLQVVMKTISMVIWPNSWRLF